MKRLFTLIVGFAVLWIAGCDLQMPETVEVKASPSFEVPGGSRDVVLSEVWDIDAELDKIADPSMGLESVTDDPEGRYALQLNKELASISVSDFAGDTLALDTITQPIDVGYTVPEINIGGSSFQSDIPSLELPSTVEVDPIQITDIPEPGVSGPVSSTETTPTLTTSGYTTVTFDSGTLNAEISLVNAGAGVSVDISSAEIQGAGGTLPILASNTPVTVDPSTPQVLQFPLASETLPNSFEVSLSITVSGGTLGQAFDLNAVFTFVGPPTISGASGVNFTDTGAVTGSHTIPMGSDVDFQSLTIGSGTLDLTNTFPAGWSGISTPVQVTLQQGGVNVPGGTWPATLPLDLSGLTLDTQDITVLYTADVWATDATFSLSPTDPEITTNVAGSIGELSEVNVDETAFDTVQSFSQAIDQPTRDLVDSVTFTQPVITIDLENNLPVDVAVDISTTPPATGTQVTFNVQEVDTVFPAGGTPTVHNWDIGPTNPLPIDMDTIDIDLAVTLDDGSPGDGTLTLTNVTPGQSYSLTGNVNAAFTVEQLVIANALFSGQFPEAPDPGLDFSALGNFLPDTISFTDIQTNLDLSAGADTGTLGLYLEVDYVDSDGNPVTLVLVEDDTTAGDPKQVSADETIDLPGIQDVINARAKDIIFSYTVEASGAAINIDPANTTEDSFGAVLRSHIPFAIESDGETEIVDDTGQPIVDPLTDDILGRTGDESDEELTEMLLFAQSVSVNMDVENNIGLGLKATVTEPKESPEEPSPFSLEFGLDSGTGAQSKTIGLSNEDIQHIANDTQFTPAIRLFIPDGIHVIKRDASITLSAWLGLETDISYEFDLTESGGEE